MTEKEKRQAGMLYNSNYDTVLVTERLQCQAKCQRYNAIDAPNLNERAQYIEQIIGKFGEGLVIEQPFYCDYGYNITIGKNFYANYNLVILDEAQVTIGDFVFIAPNCGIYTATHPVNIRQRNQGLEYAKPITIGNHVWIGAGVQIMPDVTIGDGSVIGAGSVVTKDIPAGVIAVGNPCKVVRKIDDSDLQV